MTVCKTPNVLVIHLKRFSYGNHIGKITKPIQFELTMDLPCSGEINSKVEYNLIGLIVHYGHSNHSGHYVAFVKVW